MINFYINEYTTRRLYTRGGFVKDKPPPYYFDQEGPKYFQQDPSKNNLRCVKINPSYDTYKFKKFNMRTFEPVILNKILKLLNNLNKPVIRTGMLSLFGNFDFL